MDEKKYNQTIESFSENEEVKRSNKRCFDYINDGVQKIEFQLDFTSSEALFYPKHNYMRLDGQIDLEQILYSSGMDGKRYLNLKEDISILQRYYLDKDWLITDSIEKLDWIITREARKIQGHTSFKAIAELGDNFFGLNQVEAWFTPDIPYQFGPLGFIGLPGLILELEYRFYIVSVDEINFSDKEIKIIRPNKGKVVSREEYKKKTKEISDKLKGGYR